MLQLLQHKKSRKRRRIWLILIVREWEKVYSSKKPGSVRKSETVPGEESKISNACHFLDYGGFGLPWLLRPNRRNFVGVCRGLPLLETKR